MYGEELQARQMLWLSCSLIIALQICPALIQRRETRSQNYI